MIIKNNILSKFKFNKLTKKNGLLYDAIANKHYMCTISDILTFNYIFDIENFII